jgi:hypothetical protein
LKFLSIALFSSKETRESKNVRAINSSFEYHRWPQNLCLAASAMTWFPLRNIQELQIEIQKTSGILERTSKNEVNTSMAHWTINRNTSKNIREWSQYVNVPLNHQSSYMKGHQGMKPTSQWALGPSIKMHERTSKN